MIWFCPPLAMFDLWLGLTVETLTVSALRASGNIFQAALPPETPKAIMEEVQ